MRVLVCNVATGELIVSARIRKNPALRPLPEDSKHMFREIGIVGGNHAHAFGVDCCCCCCCRNRSAETLSEYITLLLWVWAVTLGNAPSACPVRICVDAFDQRVQNNGHMGARRGVGRAYTRVRAPPPRAAAS